MSERTSKGWRKWIAGAVLLIGVLVAFLLSRFVGITPQVMGFGNGAPPADTPAPSSSNLPPAAPSNLTADVVAVFDVPVGWMDNSDNEDGFNVYRQRIDVLGEKEKAGASGENAVEFLDEGTFCGATYQYTVASYNEAGESPASACWQITLPPCPFPSNVKLTAGDTSNPADFSLAADGRNFMADQPGQNGLVDLGDVGATPLHHVPLPNPSDYKKDGVGVILGHTYAALMKDGQSVMVFTVRGLDSATADTIGIIWRPGKTISGACQPLGIASAGGACVDNDGICDPTCTGGGRDADCGGPCVSGDGVCVAECGSATGGTPILTVYPGDPYDVNCEQCATTYYQIDTDCDESHVWSETVCTPIAGAVCEPPCAPDDPTCAPGTETPPPCDPQTDPYCGTPPPCDPQTDPNCGTPPPCVPGAATNGNCGDPTPPVTEPPPMCGPGWAPSPEQGCTCCGTDQICPDGSITANAGVCGGGNDCRCRCVRRDPKSGQCIEKRNTCTGEQC